MKNWKQLPGFCRVHHILKKYLITYSPIQNCPTTQGHSISQAVTVLSAAGGSAGEGKAHLLSPGKGASK